MISQLLASPITTKHIRPRFTIRKYAKMLFFTLYNFTNFRQKQTVTFRRVFLPFAPCSSVLPDFNPQSIPKFYFQTCKYLLSLTYCTSTSTWDHFDIS